MIEALSDELIDEAVKAMRDDVHPTRAQKLKAVALAWLRQIEDGSLIMSPKAQAKLAAVAI